MAAISITAANMIPSVDALRLPGYLKAHEAVTAGQLAYLYSADGTYGLADANGITETNTCAGIFENNAAAGQVVSIIYFDPSLTIGGTMTLGKLYIIGATPGQITESADAASGWHVQYVGMSISSSVMYFKPNPVSSSAIA